VNLRSFSHKPHRQLILSKIDMENNIEYQNKVNKIFNNPDTYFDFDYQGTPVVIGRKTHKITNVIKLTNPSKRKSIFLMKNKNANLNTSRNTKGNSTRQSKTRISNNNLNIYNNNNNNNNILPENKRYIGDEDLNEIYKKFQDIKYRNENNIKYKKNKEKEFYTSIIRTKTAQNEMKRIFKLQQDNFDYKNNNDKKIENISMNLSKKIKRPISKLLMTQSDSYRIQKEFKNKLGDEIENLSNIPAYKFPATLRDNDLHYINYGSKYSPKWQLILDQNKVYNKHKEIARKPNNFSKTFNNFFKNNNYMKRQLPNKTFYSLTENMDDKINMFNNMRLEGKDLLTFEMENSKLIKGRKIITQNKKDGNMFLSNINNNNFNIDKNVNDVVYGENTDLKDLFSNRQRNKFD